MTSYSMMSAAEYSGRKWHDNFHDAGHFVCQSGVPNFGSGNVGKLTEVKSEGMC